MFGNTGNNTARSQQPSINTRLATWYGDLSCLQIGYWNTNLSLRFNVCTGKNADGVNQYDFNNKLTTALTPNKADAIVKWANGTTFDPAGSKQSISFKIGAGETTKLAVEFEPNGDDGDFYISVYRNITENGTTSDAVRYKFNKTKISFNWDASTGKIGSEETKDNEFYEFLDFCLQLSKYAENTFKSHLTKYIDENRAAFSNNGGYMPNGGNGGGQPQSNYTAPVSTGDDYPF